MRFDLTDLRLFLHVNEAGTITAGAERSHMTLASASERLRGMEDALGVPLLLRERRGVRPTPAGHSLLHHARVVSQQIDRMQGDLGDFSAGLKGQVRLLCNSSALSEHLPAILSRYLAGHPGISIDLEERASEHIVAALRGDQCDIGIVSDAVGLEGLEAFDFRPDPLVVIVPRGHALARRRRVAFAEIADGEFVGLAEGSALQTHLAQHARQLGKRLSYRIRLRSFESICRMVGLGIGMAIVPDVVAVRCERGDRIRRIALSDGWASRKLKLCVRRFDELPVHAQQMARAIVDVSSPDTATKVDSAKSYISVRHRPAV